MITDATFSLPLHHPFSSVFVQEGFLGGFNLHLCATAMSIQLVKKEEEEEQAFDMKYAFKTQSGSEVIGFLTVSLFRAP